MPESEENKTEEVKKPPMPIRNKQEERPGTRPPGCDIYALLVGIDKYKHIRNLKGCKKDLNKIEEFLEQRFDIDIKDPSLLEKIGNAFGNKQQDVIDFENLDEFITEIPIEGKEYGVIKILRIEDRNATYDGIIKGFEKFLNKAIAKDCAWFHFSGHGTISATAKEFTNLENGMDNCLMCHDFKMDSEGNTQGLLADKEMAQLLNGVVGESGLYHMLVTLDCCNAGSGTRGEDKIDEEWGVRSVDLGSSDKPRELKDYYGYEAGDKYKLPPSHVMLSACSNLELAGDSGSGGAFTTDLLKVLSGAKNGPGRINYADLYQLTRFELNKRDHKQTPQFETIGDTQAYSLFLDGSPDGDPDRYPVVFISGRGYVVNCGAIHHLPQNPAQPITLSVYSQQDDESPILTTKVLSVGPEYSTIKVEEGELTKDKAPFYAVFNHIPAAKELVKISGEDESGIQALKDAWNDRARSLNIHVLEDDDPSPFTIEVEANGGKYVLKDVVSDKTIKEEYDVSTTDALLADIIKIVKWRRTMELEKDRSKLFDKVNLTFTIYGKDEQEDQKVKMMTILDPDDERVKNAEKKVGQIVFEGWKDLIKDMEVVEAPAGATEREVIIHASSETKIPNKGESLEDRFYTIQPEVTVKDYSDTLHFYLLTLYEDYGIYLYFDETKEFRPEDSSGIIEYSKADGGLQGVDEFVYHFKLIVTTRPLDHHQLQQVEIPGSRAKLTKSKDPDKGFDEWWVINKTIRFIRKK